MKHTFFLAPAGPGSGLTSVALGLVRALDRRGIRVAFCKPIGQTRSGKDDPSSRFISATTGLRPEPPIPLAEAESFLTADRVGDLMEEVMNRFHRSCSDADVTIVEGLRPSQTENFVDRLNAEMARTLDAEVILIANLPKEVSHLRGDIETAAAVFQSGSDSKVIGFVLNKVPFAAGPDPAQEDSALRQAAAALVEDIPLVRSGQMPMIGAIPFDPALISPRTRDVAAHLKAQLLNAGELDRRRVRSIALCARTVRNMLHVCKPGALLVTPADRDDICLAAALSELNQVPLAGIVLTGDSELDPRVMDLCRPAWRSGLPVLRVLSASYETATALHQMNDEVPFDDLERIEAVMDSVARRLDGKWLDSRCQGSREPRMSPAAFRFTLTQRARSAGKRIILPEGDEPRTIRAAQICQERGIACCLLVGNPDEIRRVARSQAIELHPGIEMVDPAEVRSRYIEPLCALRRSKKMEPIQAAEALQDNVMLGTVMLALGEVDGLVSGAVHSTANTIRPALQIIKTHKDARLVSSVFFMCLPEQVFVYGDCAVNPNPDATALADIAIQSAESAAQFGIPPRVALISYSTGESGSGEDVDKVREATRLARERRPDLPIDGPLQYDAASVADVAKTKAPESPVAGRATVFIFPDLNTGNTTYKAVQRSANCISIGPMLQGLKKPVNDLSRGALVDDIVYTIAITAVQAAERSESIPIE